jgi:hypothetical protein
MDDILTNVGWVCILAAIALGLVTLLVWATRRKPKPSPSAEVKRDWIRTGRINCTGPEEEDVQGTFTLQVEEDRRIADVGGSEFTELRWRSPTRREVRDIVRTYNSASMLKINVWAPTVPRDVHAPVGHTGPIGDFLGDVATGAVGANGPAGPRGVES